PQGRERFTVKVFVAGAQIIVGVVRLAPLHGGANASAGGQFDQFVFAVRLPTNEIQLIRPLAAFARRLGGREMPAAVAVMVPVEPGPCLAARIAGGLEPKR